MSARLGVNVDHVATLRQSRGTSYPDPVAAATYAEEAGADQITIHLREDRRHIQERDLRTLRKIVTTSLNLEMACDDAIITIACEVKPDIVTLVPERRHEVTTESGLDVRKHHKRLRAAMAQLRGQGIRVSLFLDPDAEQITAAQALEPDAVELHTGGFCSAASVAVAEHELARLQASARTARQLGYIVAAGHGLHYENIRRVIRALPEVTEYNIGHSIVGRAVFVGMAQAVREMKACLQTEVSEGI